MYSTIDTQLWQLHHKNNNQKIYTVNDFNKLF